MEWNNVVFCLLVGLALVSAGPNIHGRKQAKEDAMRDSGADFDRQILDAMGEDEDWDEEDDYADDPDDWHHNELTHQEKLNRFTHLAKKMDANRDGFVDKVELITWTLKALQNMDMKEIDDDWDVSDHDEDGYISWEEYVENIYGVEPRDQEDFSVEQLESDAALQDYNRAYHREFSKFMAADANEDGKLSKEEYATFFNPGKNQEQTDYAIKEALHFVDTNGDKMVSREEYNNDYKNPGYKRHSTYDDEADQDLFKELDLNNNDFLDGDELLLWIQSDNGEIAVDEAAHLLDAADTDHDDKLTMQEVVDAMEEFLESDATEYGEMLRFHDEL